MKRRPTKRSKEGQAALTHFQQEFCHRAPCMCCGKVCEQLDAHHIVERRGVIYDDRRNLFAACRTCHMRIHGATLEFRMGRYDPIPLRRVLEVKQQRDGLDLAFLRVLAGPGDGRPNPTFGEGLE